MVMLAGSTGLRRSELFALRWCDVNFQTMEISVLRSCVRGRFGKTKTEASGKPVPLHVSVSEVLLTWKGIALPGGVGLSVSVFETERHGASNARHGPQEDHPSCPRPCRGVREADWMAFVSA
jgi:integrase